MVARWWRGGGEDGMGDVARIHDPGGTGLAWLAGFTGKAYDSRTAIHRLMGTVGAVGWSAQRFVAFAVYNAGKLAVLYDGGGVTRSPTVALGDCGGRQDSEPPCANGGGKSGSGRIPGTFVKGSWTEEVGRRPYADCIGGRGQHAVHSPGGE